MGRQASAMKLVTSPKRYFGNPVGALKNWVAAMKNHRGRQNETGGLPKGCDAHFLIHNTIIHN
jgi:hypothetical protein